MRKLWISIELMFLALFAAIILASCQKEEFPKPQTLKAACSETQKLVDVEWIPNDSVFAEMIFHSNGVHYLHGSVDGTWYAHTCDSIKISRGSGSFFTRINFISDDTLKLQNYLFQKEVVYHK